MVKKMTDNLNFDSLKTQIKLRPGVRFVKIESISATELNRGGFKCIVAGGDPISFGKAIGQYQKINNKDSYGNRVVFVPKGSIQIPYLPPCDRGAKYTSEMLRYLEPIRYSRPSIWWYLTELPRRFWGGIQNKFFRKTIGFHLR